MTQTTGDKPMDGEYSMGIDPAPGKDKGIRQLVLRDMFQNNAGIGTLAKDIHQFDGQMTKLRGIFAQLDAKARAAIIDTLERTEKIGVKLIPANFGILVDDPDDKKVAIDAADVPCVDEGLEKKYRRRWVGGRYIDERIE